MQGFISIVLADDHKVVRQGIRAILETEPDFRVVGEASNGAEAVALVKDQKPNVLVTDLGMEGMSGIEVTRTLRETCPETRTVILSMHDNMAYVSLALKSGARGYVLKAATTEDLVRAVREASSGGCYLSPPLTLGRLKSEIA